MSLREHYEALRAADKELAAERDRRYKEVAAEREKALQIKEEADKEALRLAREIQVYKDEKANNLREQIGNERVDMATKDDVKPLTAYVASQMGRSAGVGAYGSAMVVAASILIAVIGLVISAWVATH